MAPLAPAAEQTTVAYQTATDRLRGNLAAYVAALWASLGLYSDVQAAQFVGQMVPVVGGAQQQMASLTSAYLGLLRGHRTGRFLPEPVDPRQVTGAAVRNGVAPADVYHRPFDQVWRDIGNGKPPQDAITSGLARAQTLAATDVQLAKTHTTREVLKTDPDVIGYMRVLRGESSCNLCTVASTRIYHKAGLMPIHPHCDCAVSPVVGPLPPPAEPQTTFTVRRHGELGPVLYVRGDHFTGPHDLTLT